MADKTAGQATGNKAGGRSREKSDELLAGIDTMIETGRADELEQLLDTLVESEPADPSDDDAETRTYARGVRDGLALARRLPENAG